MKLLSREQWREAVFVREGGCCAVCQQKAVDAHHLIDRKLWADGGYYLDNGVALCEEDHYKAEQTIHSVEFLRTRAGIARVLLPSQLSAGEVYDKWGNIILPNKTRVRGPLFDQEGVQKILSQAGVLADFTEYVKYPRTPHLPWSEGLAEDDMLLDRQGFTGREVVVTEKLDGESTTCYRDYIHARSLSAMRHPSQTRVKQWHAGVRQDIPEGYRLAMENVSAVHTIEYPDLDSLFVLLSVWNEQNYCLSWDETLEWSELLSIPVAPVLFRGTWDEKTIRELYSARRGGHDMEGYVVRVTDGFRYGDFQNCVAKFVSGRFREALERREGVHWASAVVRWNQVRAQGRGR